MELHHSDSLEILVNTSTDSIDSIVTDPPYGIAFMGKDWDKALPPERIWRQCYRVLKPGAYLIAMSASRTFHRLGVQLEDIGFIVHPMIGWIYGSGFPKATDLSKQFDKQAGAEREIVGRKNTRSNIDGCNRSSKVSSKGTGYGSIKDGECNITAPATDQAKQWDGWKYGLQSLKPALEPIGVFQKPHLKPMVRNVEKHGVGAMNIDGCRVPTTDKFGGGEKMSSSGHKLSEYGHYKKDGFKTGSSQGRHPANLLHDGSESVEAEFLEQGGVLSSGGGRKTTAGTKTTPSGWVCVQRDKQIYKKDSGSCSRFFNSLPISELDAPFLYCPKASKSERNAGLEGFDKKEGGTLAQDKWSQENFGHAGTGRKRENHHPTVKPVKLMQWLVRLVTPPEGTCLDPFMGSGTTGMAAALEKKNFIGIEREAEFYQIAKARIDHATKNLL